MTLEKIVLRVTGMLDGIFVFTIDVCLFIIDPVGPMISFSIDINFYNCVVFENYIYKYNIQKYKLYISQLMYRFFLYSYMHTHSTVSKKTQSPKRMDNRNRILA